MRRRQLVQTIAFLAAGVAIPAAPADSAAVQIRSDENLGPECLSRAFFEARRGEIFRVGGQRRHALLLTEILDATRHDPDSQFHVIFDADHRPRLEDGIYRLEHERQGHVDLYLARSDHYGDRQRYVATINRSPAV